LFLGDINILTLFFFILTSTLITNNNTAVHLLLTAELIWITLYSLTLLVGFIYDNLNLLSLTFFFLIFSAIELGVGLAILLVQHILTRTVSLAVGDINIFKYNDRFIRSLNINNLNLKV
jgi:NADH:ubiquinone oxidoreductase subunit K